MPSYKLKSSSLCCSVLYLCPICLSYFCHTLQIMIPAAPNESADSGVDTGPMNSRRTSSTDRRIVPPEDRAVAALKRSRPAGQASDSDADSVSSEGCVSSKRSSHYDTASPPADSEIVSVKLKSSSATDNEQNLLELSDLPPALASSVSRPVRKFIILYCAICIAVQ